MKNPKSLLKETPLPEAMKKNIPFVLILLAPIFSLEAKIQQVDKVAAQPLILQVKHLREALQYLGEPLPSSTVKQLETATKTKAGKQVTKIVQAALDPFTLSVVNINPESRVKVAPGLAKPELAEHGLRNFLV